MSGFDEKFLQVYDNLKQDKLEQPDIPSVWNKISSSQPFRKKLSATAELGVTLCTSPFSWADSENNLEDRGIEKLDITPLLEPFAEETPDTDTLLTCAQKLKSTLHFTLPVVDIISLIRSCV